MKIIDLLNKIANGEEVPEKIKIGADIFTKFNYSKGDGTFISSYESNNRKYYIHDLLYPQYLNDEVEILEEEKKIPEKLKDILIVDDLIPPVDENMYKIWTQTIKNQNKINEICNYLKSKGD